MAITRAKTSSIAQGPSTKRTLLAGNDTILPGSYESIATVTVGAGGQSTIEFTSIPSTYSHLQIRGILRSSSGSMNGVVVRFNADTAGNYARHLIGGNGTSVSASSVTSGTNAGIGYFPGSSDTANIFGAVVWEILDYASTSKAKTSRNIYGADLNSAANSVGLYSSGWFKTPEAITTISVVSGSGNWVQYSQLALYGIR